jgi:hypothetical protein
LRAHRGEGSLQRVRDDGGVARSGRSEKVALLVLGIRRFHESNPLEVGQQQVAQFLDLMDVHVALAQRNAATLASALRAVVA